ncbi:MAG: hypothetical protein ACK4GW_12660 [Pseudorhodobacter sp.]
MAKAEKIYLILTSQVLVGQDMAQCITDLFPQARVLQFQRLDALREALAELPDVDTAFLEAQSIASATEATIRAVESLGGKIVLLGAEDGQAESEARRWRALPIPFDTAMLHQRLI